MIELGFILSIEGIDEMNLSVVENTWISLKINIKLTNFKIKSWID